MSDRVGQVLIDARVARSHQPGRHGRERRDQHRSEGRGLAAAQPCADTSGAGGDNGEAPSGSAAGEPAAARTRPTARSPRQRSAARESFSWPDRLCEVLGPARQPCRAGSSRRPLRGAPGFRLAPDPQRTVVAAAPLLVALHLRHDRPRPARSAARPPRNRARGLQPVRHRDSDRARRRRGGRTWGRAVCPPRRLSIRRKGPLDRGTANPLRFYSD